MTDTQREKFIQDLRKRFEKHMERHPQVTWSEVEERLMKHTKVLDVVMVMEESGGEPDVVILDKEIGWVFCDCSEQSPSERRSLCYDRAALDSRKEAKPKGDAVSAARDMGVELLTEEQYRSLQTAGEFDTKTSSWIVTPVEIRKRGGAIFADRRYDHIFVYHNGAESYYAARGWRGWVRV